MGQKVSSDDGSHRHMVSVRDDLINKLNRLYIAVSLVISVVIKKNDFNIFICKKITKYYKLDWVRLTVLMIKDSQVQPILLHQGLILSSRTYCHERNRRWIE